MHLRTKLTAGVVLATLLTFAVVGYVAIRTSKYALRDRVDAQLLADLADVRESTTVTGGTPSVGDEYAVVVVTPDGTTVRSMTGSRGDPDAPPDVRFDELPGDGRVAYVDGADGTEYRIASTDLGDGRRLVVGAPIDDLHGLVDDLTRRLLLIALVAGSALAGVAWWWIRRTTRPIETLTGRADAIARGDTDRSLSVPATTAELASLADALDAMVASVDASLAVRARSEARLREFIANVSHELRTPLTSVSGYLQLDLDGALADPDEHRRAIARAADEAARMGRLVADLQLLAELDEPDPDALWSTEPIDVAALVADTVRSAATLDTVRTWKADLPSAPLVAHADRDRLRQVLDNLLANVRPYPARHVDGRARRRVRPPRRHRRGRRRPRAVGRRDGPRLRPLLAPGPLALPRVGRQRPRPVHRRRHHHRPRRNRHRHAHRPPRPHHPPHRPPVQPTGGRQAERPVAGLAVGVGRCHAAPSLVRDNPGRLGRLPGGERVERRITAAQRCDSRSRSCPTAGRARTRRACRRVDRTSIQDGTKWTKPGRRPYVVRWVVDGQAFNKAHDAHLEDGRRLRWAFADVTPDSFTWSNAT